MHVVKKFQWSEQLLPKGITAAFTNSWDTLYTRYGICSPIFHVNRGAFNSFLYLLIIINDSSSTALTNLIQTSRTRRIGKKNTC